MSKLIVNTGSGTNLDCVNCLQGKERVRNKLLEWFPSTENIKLRLVQARARLQVQSLQVVVHMGGISMFSLSLSPPIKISKNKYVL